MNWRFVIADLLDPLAPGETWTADDLRQVAKALAAALFRPLAAERPGQVFTVQVIGPLLAEEEPFEVCVTFSQAR